MQIKKTKLKGLKIVTNKIYKDSRGYFKEDFKQTLLKGFKFIFSNTDLDNFNGDVKLFFKSLENKINKIF